MLNATSVGLPQKVPRNFLVPRARSKQSWVLLFLLTLCEEEPFKSRPLLFCKPSDHTLVLTGDAFVPKCNLLLPQCSPSQQEHHHSPSTGQSPGYHPPPYPLLCYSRPQHHYILPIPPECITSPHPLCQHLGPGTITSHPGGCLLPNWSSHFLSAAPLQGSLLRASPDHVTPLLSLHLGSPTAPRSRPGCSTNSSSPSGSAPTGALGLSSHPFPSSTHTPPSSARHSCTLFLDSSCKSCTTFPLFWDSFPPCSSFLLPLAIKSQLSSRKSPLRSQRPLVFLVTLSCNGLFPVSPLLIRLSSASVYPTAQPSQGLGPPQLKNQQRKKLANHMCAHVHVHVCAQMCKHVMHRRAHVHTETLRVQVLPSMGKMSITRFPRIWTLGASELQTRLGLELNRANSKLVCFSFWTLRLQWLKNKVHKPLTSLSPTCSRWSRKERRFLPVLRSQPRAR